MNIRIAIAAGLLLASVTGVSAHHVVTNFFDIAKPVMIQGTLTRVDWRMPHVILRLETRTNNGSVASWNVETRAPQGLAQAGLTRDAFKIGERFSATVCVAKDGTRWAVTHEIARPGGKAEVSVGGC